MDKGLGKAAGRTPAGGARVNHEGAESELAPGFSVQRRSLLWLPVLTASALLLGHPGELFARKRDGGEKSGATGPRADAGGPGVGFSFLNIDKNPVDVEKRVYQATWMKLS